MAVIKRNDGTHFIAQAYRERITVKNKRLLVQEIRMLSSSHGSFISIMRKIKRELEVAISQDQGYLLGELVWDFFGRPDNLIFCEAIAESANCILVVIRDAAVYLDMKLLSNQIKDELTPILADDREYDVYTFGDVPVRDTDTFGDATFKLPKSIVAKFNHLKESVFERLLASPEFELRPLPTILRSKYLRSHSAVLVTAALVIVFGGGWWLFGGPSTPQTMPTQVSTVPHWQNYEVALMTPSPTKMITELGDKIDQLYLIPGWEAAHITFNGEKYQVDMRSHGGDLWYLTDWAKQHYYDLRITSSGAKLTLESHLKKRSLPQKYPNMQMAAETFMARMKQVLTTGAVHVDSSGQHGGMQVTKFTLDLTELSPDLLDLIGQELEDLPLSLSSVDLRLQNGLIDGKIQLSLWGR
jgi:hypothetical protein